MGFNCLLVFAVLFNKWYYLKPLPIFVTKWGCMPLAFFHHFITTCGCKDSNTPSWQPLIKKKITTLQILNLYGISVLLWKKSHFVANFASDRPRPNPPNYHCFIRSQLFRSVHSRCMCLVNVGREIG